MDILAGTSLVLLMFLTQGGSVLIPSLVAGLIFVYLTPVMHHRSSAIIAAKNCTWIKVCLLSNLKIKKTILFFTQQITKFHSTKVIDAFKPRLRLDRLS